MLRKTFLFVGLWGLAGCIGTDYITDALSSFEPRLEITPPSLALLVGDMAALDAVYYGSSGEVEGASVQWNSSDPATATVDASGQVTAHQKGQAQITAMTTDAASAPVMLTVVADPNEVAQLVVTPDTARLELNTSQLFVAEAFNLSGTLLTDKTVTWSSTDDTVARIDETGRALALQAGVAQVTATVDEVSSMAATVIVFGRKVSGSFVERAGTQYKVRGTVTLQEQPTGGLVLEFADNFETSAGPGLQVYLSKEDAVGSSSISLGALQQNTGAQSYPLSSNIQLEDYEWVIIHCVPFNVTFGSAQLR